MSLQDKVQLVLVQPSEGGNVGACCRALMNCGFSELTLVDPQVKDWSQASKLAVHARPVLERARAQALPTIQQAVAGGTWVVGVSGRARKYAERKEPLGPGAFVERVRALPENGRAVLLFGPERSGLSNEQLGLCQDILCLPSSESYPSMNLAQALMVVAWTVRMADLAGEGADEVLSPDVSGTVAARVPREVISAADLEGLIEHARFSLTNLDYLDPQNPRLIMDELRMVFARAELNQRELRILRGVFHRMDLFVARHGGPATPNKPRGPAADD